MRLSNKILITSLAGLLVADAIVMTISLFGARQNGYLIYEPNQTVLMTEVIFFGSHVVIGLAIIIYMALIYGTKRNYRRYEKTEMV